MSMRVLLTGASRGIGREVCLHLAGSGMKIAACASKDGDAMDSLIAEVKSLGGTVVPLIGDLADPLVPEMLVAEAIDQLGGLDAVVSNAGYAKPAALVDNTLEDWSHLLAVNLTAPWLLAKAAYPELLRHKGKYIAVASMSGVQPYPNMGAYSISKAGLLMMVRQLAQEWAAQQISINAISPGLFYSSMTAKVYQDEKLKKAREDLVPVHRIGNPTTDIAGVVEFLLSSAAGYITGQNIIVDGGLLDSMHGQIAGRPATVTRN